MAVFIGRKVLKRPVVVFSIIKLNIIVYFLWIFLGPQSSLMVLNFLTSWSSLMEGRVWTLVTSTFSHFMLFHLFINMYVFFGFGTMLENALGPRRFFNFYIMAGVVGSLAHALVSAIFLAQPGLMALGASGAVSGVIMLFSIMFPEEKILLLGLIPMPAMIGAMLFVGLDVWGLIAQTQGGTLPIGHGAHLGGALFGFVYYFLAIKRRHIKYNDNYHQSH